MVVRSLQVKESCAIQKDVGIVQRGVEGLSRYCAARLGSQMRIANCLNSMKLSACCVEKGAFTRISLLLSSLFQFANARSHEIAAVKLNGGFQEP